MFTKRSKKSLGYKCSTSLLEKGILGGPITFGLAIKPLRNRDELSQIELARKVGVSRRYLCDVEKERRFVSPEQAARIAKAFGHPPALLVQLSIQDQIESSGLKLKVNVTAA